MEVQKTVELIRFLREDLAISDASIQLTLRKIAPMPNLLPIALWQYGLVTLSQLNQRLDWKESFQDRYTD